MEDNRNGSFFKSLMAIIGFMACIAGIAAGVVVAYNKYKEKINELVKKAVKLKKKAESEDCDECEECVECDECDDLCEDVENENVEVDCEFTD